jgi:hypothetical protein
VVEDVEEPAVAGAWRWRAGLLAEAARRVGGLAEPWMRRRAARRWSLELDAVHPRRALVPCRPCGCGAATRDVQQPAGRVGMGNRRRQGSWEVDLGLHLGRPAGRLGHKWAAFALHSGPNSVFNHL